MRFIFHNPSKVARNCAITIKNVTKCFMSLKYYISGVQQQILIKNFFDGWQAILSQKNPN